MSVPVLMPNAWAPAVVGPSVPTTALWGFRFLVLCSVIAASGVVIGFTTSIAILTGVALLVAAAGLTRPTLGLLGMGVLCVIDSMTRVLIMSGGLLRYNTINYFLIAVIVISLPRVVRLKDTQTRLMFALLLIMGLGFLTSPDLPTASFSYLNLLAVTGLLIFFVRAGQDPMVYFWAALVNSCVSAICCVVFFSQIDSVPGVNPNAWAYLPVTALFSVCMGYRFASDVTQRILLLSLSIVNCTWVFLSASRGSMVVALICILYLIASTKQISLSILFIVAGIGLGLTVVSLFPSMQTYAMHRIEKLFDENHSMKSRTSGRSELVEAGLEIFRANPFGLGSGAFYTELADVAGFHKQAHSAWVRTAVENGLFGVLVFGAYIASFTLTGRNMRKPGTLRFGLFVTASLATAFCSTEFNGKGLWWLASGATALLNYAPPAVWAKEHSVRS